MTYTYDKTKAKELQDKKAELEKVIFLAKCDVEEVETELR
jgi:hypothetical protein